MGIDTGIRHDRGPVIGGVVFIVAGVFLLLEKTGYLPDGFVLHFWPMIFVLVGLVKIVYAGGRPTGFVLIAIGVFLQFYEMGLVHLNPWDLWPVFIIIAGVGMLWQALSRRESPVVTENEFDSLYVFGGGDRNINTKNFKGGSLFAVFGGYKIDFTHADMEGNQAVVEANAIFGGGEIRVPESWQVIVKGVGVFGAYEDKTRHFQPDATKPTKILVVKGVAMFGGIEIKN